jgi:hypothetical protein
VPTSMPEPLNPPYAAPPGNAAPAPPNAAAPPSPPRAPAPAPAPGGRPPLRAATGARLVERPQLMRIALVPMIWPLSAAMAISAAGRSTNCTKPQPAARAGARA